MAEPTLFDSSAEFNLLPYPQCDLTGERIGRVLVIGFFGWKITASKNQYWRCQCDCGQEFNPAKSSILRAKRMCREFSCGCVTTEKLVARGTTHANSRVGKRTPEYRAWGHIVDRCTNPNDSAWKYYGSRGIEICDLWRNSFGCFLASVGPRPSPKHSIDRINNDGNYEPGNVRWATRTEQQRNRRNNLRTIIGGNNMCLTEISEKFGMKFQTLKKRFHRGIRGEDLISPVKS